MFLSVTGIARAEVLSDREAEPVVLTGEQTPRLLGVPPGAVVGFAWFEGWSAVPTGWFQIPVQVDERKMVDYRPLGQTDMGGEPFRALAYADPHTWAEADGVPQTATDPEQPGEGAPIPGTTGDPMLDSNDEIAMMAHDAGLPAGDRAAPEGVDPSTRTSIRVTDPLDPDQHAYIYLFRTDESLAPDAGEQLVDYDRRFTPRLAGGYRTGYDFDGIADQAGSAPANPENSTVFTTQYDAGMPGRWMLDHLVIAAGTRSDVDLLDGDRVVVGQNCDRTETSFSRGAGGVIADINGPVRAIRSVVGAGDEPFAQRDYLFYDGMIETRTLLPAGDSPAIFAMDLSGRSRGMTYRNSALSDAVTIDGSQDEVPSSAASWEQFAGQDGSITNVSRVIGDSSGIERSSFYEDRTDPPANSPMRCSGDGRAYGAAGPVLESSGGGEGADRFGLVRYTWFDGPEADGDLGRLRARQVDDPMKFDVDAPEPAILVVRARPSKITLAPGERRTIRVTVRNHGRRKAARVRVCSSKTGWNRAKGRCRKAKRLGRGRAVTRRIVVRASRHAGVGKRRLWIRAAAPGARSYRNAVAVRIRLGT